MTRNQIKLGYKVPSGEEVIILPAHLIVTGITQQSGKTTTLEALIQRSALKAVVFKTKIGEKSFSSGNVIPPFFRDRSDYEFVKSLIEAYAKEKLIIEKGALMNICKGSKNLVEIKMRVDNELALGKLRGLKEEIYTRLQHYLTELIPQIQYANLSSTLNMSDGINIMNLEKFDEAAQSLIIQSVADEVLKNHRDTVIVIPEAWKFLPQKYNNPCKRVVESFIRQGATNQNFIWIDSQDMAGVDKSPLKQISTWILGYQSERNEVKHTLDQISLPKGSKPKEDDIMNLPIGHFFLSSRESVVKVYVQPSWMSDQDALEVATGQKEVHEVLSAKPIPSFNFTRPAAKETIPAEGFATKKDIAQLRIDFFNKIEELVNDVNNFLQTFSEKESPAVDEDHLVSLVLQKLPSQKSIGNQPVNTNAIVQEVLKHIPKGSGSVVYELAPLEKIKKDFLISIHDKIVSDVSKLSTDEKKALRYIESKDSDVTNSEIVTSCLLLKNGGSQATKVSNIFKELASIECIEKTAGGRYRKATRKRIKTLMENHNASEQEIENTYNHILTELL